MTISSTAFKNNSTIPGKYTCKGESIVPSLKISNIPQNTKTLAIIMDDPDAPVGLFTHWVIWNISANITNIEEGRIPNGVEGKNSTGRTGYIPPCPPSGSGVHRYQFQLFALSKEINLPEGSSREELEREMEDSILEKTELIGTYGI